MNDKNPNSGYDPEALANWQQARNRDQARAAADKAQAGLLAEIGVELMNGFNRGKTNPWDMAKLGHDTATGFEFCIERRGVTVTVTVTRDWE